MISMPRPARSGQNPDDAPREEVVLGVDTHKDLHVAAAITGIGGLLGSQSFPATAAGYRQLLDWALGFGPVNRAGVECTGSYGAALARHLRQAGVAVAEVNQPDKATRRRRGKTDAIDAEAAARAVLSGQARAVPKSGDGHAEAIRAFKMARDSAVKSRTQAINQLKAILVTADPAVREPLAGLSAKALVRACTAWPTCPAPALPRPQPSAHSVSSAGASSSSAPRPATSSSTSLLPSPPAPASCSRPSASVPTAPPPWSSPPATTPNGSAAKHPSPRSAASAPSRHHPAKPSATASIAAVTGKPTPPCTAS